MSQRTPDPYDPACVFLDMDCFFASVEEKQRGVRGRPLVVGGREGRGAVCSANRQARALGARSGESLASIRRRFGDQVTICDARMELYQAESAHVMSLLRGFGLPMEQMSIDEAAIDTRGAHDKLGSGSLAGVRIAQRMRHLVQQECGLVVSAGVSRGVVSAKMAVEDAKPDGLRVVGHDEFEEWFFSKPLQSVPGVGPNATLALQRAGLHTVRDVAQATESRLRGALGQSRGSWLFGVVTGTGDTPDVRESSAVLSIGCERTLQSAAHSVIDVAHVVDECVADVCGRALVHGVYANGVRAKITDSSGVSRSKQRVIAATRDFRSVRDVGAVLLDELVQNAHGGCRLVGVSLYSFSEYESPTLFETGSQERGFRVGAFVTHPVFGDGLVSVIGENYARVSFSDKRRDVALRNLAL